MISVVDSGWEILTQLGYHTFEVHYKSSSSISMSASWDYQTAVINVIEGLVINYNPHPGIIYPWCDTCIQFELQ